MSDYRCRRIEVALELVFDVGDRPTVTATFTPNPDLTAPPSMDGFFKVRRPDAIQETFHFAGADVTAVIPVPDGTPVGAFVWCLLLPVLDMDGAWAVHAIGSDGVEAGEALTFTVREPTIDSPLIP
jgi:hypothetical protein